MLKSMQYKVVIGFLLSVVGVVGGSGVASAKGCVKGAVVGGVAGHVAGHHAVVGAAAGCVIGHHRAKMKEKAAQQQAAQPQAVGAAAPNQPVPH
jgi:hypothetical protein